MNDKKIDELQKLYDNSKVGALVQEICEYYATRDDYEDNSYQEEIEPHEVVESVYILFCLQSREQILDEFSLIQKKYPSLYTCVSALYNNLLVNMDYRRLETCSAQKIAEYVGDISSDEVLSQADSFSRSESSLSEAMDKFYSWLHSRINA
ncbi:hypothetical protein SAMN02910451_02951 [Butyrivibrio hungatei]|uniref:Uncharacterized protein n=1 Tax=Butyrivibrio hungatei TaxID=185008 RepID=A0A1G5GMA2_9FIRM|nr:hypothetical protein [Butyrivibrio hungatei]SCY52702.1 hypothetical protein SAMN02910451_02951 [Butyrivibrio hungatei]